MELRRRDLIFAAVAAFVAWGHLTFYLPSLRWLPHAFLAGAAASFLLAAWALQRARPRVPQPPVDLADRYGAAHVAFVRPAAWKAETAALRAREEYRPRDIYPQSPAVSASADRLLGLVLRDFVESWYKHISTRPTFRNEVDNVAREALISIAGRLVDLDIVGRIVARLVPILTAHMNDFYEAERVVRGRKLNKNVTESEGLDLAIAHKYRNGNLHKAASLGFADTNLIGQQYLRSVMLRLLPKLLPAEHLTSPAVTIIAREIVASAVLAPALRLLADPDTWHQILERYGRSVLQERKNVRKLRAALDQHALPAPKSQRAIPFPKLQPNDSERKFERFIRAIRKCHTLSDARRFRSEIAIQLRKESTVENQDAIHLRRLETGKRMLDRRIAQLGAAGSVAKLREAPAESPQNGSRFESASLRDVLCNASCLSYFMEFMDRQNLMRLVQFWIVVEGFRNPLEDDNEEESDYLDGAPAWSDSDRADMAQINETYLSKPEIKISPVARDSVKTFLRAGKAATNSQYHAARRAVLRAQTAAYEEMVDPYFIQFKKSDLWFKFLATEQMAAGPVQQAQDFSDEPARSVPNRHKSHTQIANNAGAKQDLRRAAVSSADLRNTRPADLESQIRRSFDNNSPRPPLFDDEINPDPLANSTASLDSDTDVNGVVAQDSKIVDAMQVALNNIMEEQPDKDSLFSDTLRSPLDDDSLRGSIDLPRSVQSVRKEKEKPSIASLGLIDAIGRRGVFHDELFGEETKFPEDDKEDDSNENDDQDEIHEAAPGDLGLAEAIDALTLDIEKLVTQESIVDSLTRKAELTNNAAELRILRKSKASLQREINRKELQRQQYIIQESDNSLYGRASISIKSIMIGTEEDGKEFAMYIIEVTRQAGEQMPAAAWVVTRRYSEFHELNKRLRARYPQVKSLEFPRRHMPMLKLQKDLLGKRRVLLEKYLGALLQVPAICRSRELRAFLSQQSLRPAAAAAGPTSVEADSKDFVTRIYNSVTDGMEEFLGNIPVLDQLSLAGQHLISAAATQLHATGTSTPSAAGGPTPAGEEVAASAEAEAELAALEPSGRGGGGGDPRQQLPQLEPFVKPICDLFLEVFELNRENNWLRGRAVVLVLQQLLGGTVERRVRDAARGLLSDEEGVARTLGWASEAVWPGGGARVQPPARSAAEKARSAREAGVVLASLVPDLVGSVVGRANAQAAARRMMAMMNNERLNTHLVYSLFDEVITIVFGEGVVG